MNAFVLKTALAVALSAASIMLLAAGDKQQVAASDQVVASFDRLLNHEASFVAPAVPTPKDEVDPLRAGVNAVLWKQASDHRPVRDPSYSPKPAPRN